ncbi:effector-associated domain 2-containing protein [Micromonospora sp. CA-244673]|uniref:VMAP-C domain-containing protein n=1 Tax=Micromonospora sp. CA-244673 TaxID=3239958 RepID=UPI003D942B47
MRPVREASRRYSPAVAEERRRLVGQIATVMEASSVIRDPSSRQLLLQELSHALAGALGYRELSLLRPQIVELVTVCVDRPGGLRCLVECMELLEPGTEHTVALLRLADEWHAIELFTDYDIPWLRGLLSTVDVTADLRRFVAETRAAPAPPWCRTAWDLFTHLASANSHDSVPPWLPLLDRLATAVPEVSRDRMREFVAQLSQDWGITDQVEESQPDPPAPIGTAYLVIQFEKYGGDDDTYIMSHWYQWASPVWQPIRGEDRHVSYGELEAAVDQVINETERRWADQVGAVTIEFVLPWQLINEPVDTWRKELQSLLPSPLTTEYPLVIRSLERIRASQWHRVWRSRWQGLASSDSDRQLIHCASRHHVDVQLEATLKRKSGAAVLVLSESPTANSDGERQLLVGLRSGVPAIVWHRNAPSMMDLCETVASMIGDQTSGRGVVELPHHAAHLRQLAWSEDPKGLGQHMGHGFVILFDDPDRQPGGAASADGDRRKVLA